MQLHPSPIAWDELPYTLSGVMQRLQSQRITSGERVSLINVRTSFDGSQRRLPRGRTLLCAFVVVLFFMNSAMGELVPLKSSVRSKLRTSDTTVEQLASLPRKRILQSSPTPSPSTELWSLHVNAGGSENYTDANGTAWIADSVYGVEGQRYRPSACPSSMTPTADATIYCSQRAFSSSQSNPPFVYRIPVPKASQYEIRLHFAEIFFTVAGARVFNVLVENTLIENLDVFEQVGAFAPYVVSIQTSISDGNATIQFSEVVHSPFVSAIEIFEVEENDAPSASPVSSPVSATSVGEVRVNAGGALYIDSLGNTWVGDKFFRGKGTVSDENCPGNITNTLDPSLFCTQRYFESTDALPFAYNIPVNETSQYLVRLYFSETTFTSPGERIFDVWVEEELAMSSFDIVTAAGGSSVAYIASFLTNVSDGNATIEFIPVVENPTISAIEVIKVNGNGTVVQPLVPSAAPSASPTPDIDGFALAECSAYDACADAGFTGLCCPMTNGESRECCLASFLPSEVPSGSPISNVFITPTASPSSKSSISWSPSVSLPSASPNTRSFEFDETHISVSKVAMILGYSSQEAQQTESLDSNCTQSWKNAIQERIEAEVDSVIQRYETMSVVLQNTSRASNFTYLSLSFDVIITIRSALQDHDANRYIKGPFDSRSDKRSFLDSLEALGCPEFEKVETLEIIVPTPEATTAEKDDSSDSKDWTLVYIIAGSIGAAILVIFYTVFCRRRAYRRKTNHVTPEPVSLSISSPKGKLASLTPSEVDQEEGYTDISTLGDPIISAGTSDDASTMGSNITEYDFNKAFVDVESVVSESHIGGGSTAGNSLRQSVVTPDDLLSVNDIVSAVSGDILSSMFQPEFEFNVVAPPGVLGLILETSTGDGRPMVNSIKPSSCLNELVMVGDRLISVDDENVSGMTASNVSRLIASRLDKPRVMVFKRRIQDTSTGAC